MLKLQMIVTLGIASALTGAVGVKSQDLDIGWHTIDGGGAVFSSGGDYELSGTIGQPDANAIVMTGDDLELTGGFWFGQVSGDGNYDGGVDLSDFQALEGCLSEPGGGLGTGCASFDFDGDEDVDLKDFAELQIAFTG